jgi:hypothetical protein
LAQEFKGVQTSSELCSEYQKTNVSDWPRSFKELSIPYDRSIRMRLRHRIEHDISFQMTLLLLLEAKNWSNCYVLGLDIITSILVSKTEVLTTLYSCSPLTTTSRYWNKCESPTCIRILF